MLYNWHRNLLEKMVLYDISKLDNDESDNARNPLQKHRMSFTQTYRSLFLLCPNPRKHYCPITPKKRFTPEGRTNNKRKYDRRTKYIFFPNKINLVISVRDYKIVGIVSLLHNGVRKCEKETGTIMILIVLVFVGSDARSLWKYIRLGNSVLRRFPFDCFDESYLQPFETFE